MLNINRFRAIGNISPIVLRSQFKILVSNHCTKQISVKKSIHKRVKIKNKYGCQVGVDTANRSGKIQLTFYRPFGG